MPSDPCLSRDEVRELDRRAIEDYGIPSIVLMENAGRACAAEVPALAGDDPRPVLVLCGPGNNGGDGLVVARTVSNRGRRAEVVFVGPQASLAAAKGDVAKNLALWRGLGGEVAVISSTADFRPWKTRLSGASVVVDALFGTGLTRALGSPWRELVTLLARTGRPVLAVDIPSGLDADTGEVLGAAVRADVTVSFVARKRGFDRGQGPALCGRVVLAEIGIPRAWLDPSVW